MQTHEIRSAKFAGSFYPANAGEIIASMGDFFNKYPTHLDADRIKPLMVMLPHAGHVYSGAVTAQTLAEIELAPRIIILSPNHTGRGQNFGVWPAGAWQNPIGLVPTDRFLAEKLVQPVRASSSNLNIFGGDNPPKGDNLPQASIPSFSSKQSLEKKEMLGFPKGIIPFGGESERQSLSTQNDVSLPSPFVYDTQCHENDHSIEVILPFLQYSVPILYIVPVCVSHLEKAKEAAERIVDIITAEKAEGREVSILVSSDMNHFSDEEENRRKDKLALEAFLARDPHALLEIVMKEKISMCGVIGAIVGLLAANKLGATQSKLVAYDTSAHHSGDTSRVVGYAGAYVW